MTTVQITLPDQLAQEAQRVGEFFAAIDRMAASDEPPAMSPEEVAAEIAKMRAERRATDAS